MRLLSHPRQPHPADTAEDDCEQPNDDDLAPRAPGFEPSKLSWAAVSIDPVVAIVVDTSAAIVVGDPPTEPPSSATAVVGPARSSNKPSLLQAKDQYQRLE